MTEILVGSGATATLVPGPYQGIVINSIGISIPNDEVGTTDPSVSLSGSVSGVYSFHSSVAPNIRYITDETVLVTTSGFTAETSAVVSYTIYGDGSAFYIDLNKSQLPLPRWTERV